METMHLEAIDLDLVKHALEQLSLIAAAAVVVSFCCYSQISIPDFK